MKTPVILALLGVFAVSGAGCSFRYDEAASLRPTGDEFSKALHAGYLELARAEMDELDLDDTDAFSDRAARAAKGETVTPEAISNRTLPADKQSELAAARKRLVTALDGKARKTQPREAARAQLAYECWMQEQEENFQPDDIAACRREFTAAVLTLEAPIPTAAMRPAGHTPRPILAAANRALNTTQTGYVVMFDIDSASVSRTAREIVDRAVATAKKFSAAIIRIAGHADRSGKRPHNAALSQRRAETVAGAFARAGIAKSAIRVVAHGEDKPAVLTPDGIVEPRNRRVEIGIDTGGARTAELR